MGKPSTTENQLLAGVSAPSLLPTLPVTLDMDALRRRPKPTQSAQDEHGNQINAKKQRKFIIFQISMCTSLSSGGSGSRPLLTMTFSKSGLYPLMDNEHEHVATTIHPCRPCLMLILTRWNCARRSHERKLGEKGYTYSRFVSRFPVDAHHVKPLAATFRRLNRKPIWM